MNDPPVNYTKLSYIESAGSQFIDTGIIPNQDTRIVLDCVVLDSGNAANGVGFIPYGSAISYNNSAFECYSWNGTAQINYDGQYSMQAEISNGMHVAIDQNKNTTTIVTPNGVTSLDFEYHPFTCPDTLYLFGSHRGPMYGKQRISSAVIYQNDIKAREFIPVKTNTGEYGMFDTVWQLFYPNLGTGAFLPGEIEDDLAAVYIPKITSALISPNPSSINSNFLISVSANDEMLLISPPYLQSNEIYSGEAS